VLCRVFFCSTRSCVLEEVWFWRHSEGRVGSNAFKASLSEIANPTFIIRFKFVLRVSSFFFFFAFIKICVCHFADLFLHWHYNSVLNLCTGMINCIL